jgi:hypothetical protein
MKIGIHLGRVAILLAVLTGAPRLAAQVAVVVGPDSPLREIALNDLRSMYLGQLTKLQTGERVVLLESPGQRERFYQSALHMNPDRVKRHWIGVVFSGGGALPPKEIASAEELHRYLSEHRGAIGFIALASVGANMRILRVNGFKPEDADYPIR